MLGINSKKFNVEAEIKFNVIGVVNESYSTTTNCMCCNPSNAFYIQCDGSIHINANRISDNKLAWHKNNVNGAFAR